MRKLLLAIFLVILAALISHAAVVNMGTQGTRVFFAGLSTDLKPTTNGYGSTFFESDTGQSYVYTSAGWVLSSGMHDFVPYPGETITVSSLSVGFTSAKIHPAGYPAANWAMVIVENDQVRFLVDGTDPTSSVGGLLETGGSATIKGQGCVENLRMIRVTGDAKATCFFGRKKGAE